MRTPIFFVDRQGRETHDYVQGWPTVRVNIEVGFVRPGKPDDFIVPKFRQVTALIDTGTNHTMIGEELAQGLPPLREIPARNVGIERTGKVYSALMQIIGLGDPFALELGCASLEGSFVPMLIGRDVISQYTLVYDTPKRLFYLEKP
jgi:hypothetical protein